MSVSHITTHVLDAALGRPAAGVPVQLFVKDGEQWRLLAEAVTDGDGRAKQLGPERVPSGQYRIRFDTAAYFSAKNTDTFYPEALLSFVVDEGEAHYHVPLLLSPFAYSTYRGS